MWIENQTSDKPQVKVCLYKVDDKVDWIPVGAGVFVVPEGEDFHWEAPGGEGLSEYHIKAFHPQFFDQELCDLQNAPTAGHFVVRGGGGKYSLTQVAAVQAS